MTKAVFTNTAARLVSYLLLVATVLFWSTTGSLAGQANSQLAPLFDHAAGLPSSVLSESLEFRALGGTGGLGADTSGADGPALIQSAVPALIGQWNHHAIVFPSTSPNVRLHVTRYPVLPQAPPSLA